MSEIALTRRWVANETTMRRATGLVARTFARARARGSVPANTVVFAATALLLLGIDLPGDLAPALLAGLLGALVVLVVETAIAVAQFRNRMRADLAPGAVTESGVVAGAMRLRGPEDDAVLHTRGTNVAEHDDLVLLVGPSGLMTVRGRELVREDDLELLGQPGAPELPGRGGPQVPLTREVFVDERWRRRCGRATVMRSYRPVVWWGVVLIGPVGWSIVALLRGRSWTALGIGLVVSAALTIGLLTWLAYRTGLRSAAVPLEGEVWSAGVGPHSVRLVTPGADLLIELSALRRLVVTGDVVLLELGGSIGPQRPRELFSDADLARVRDAVAARAGRPPA